MYRGNFRRNQGYQYISPINRQYNQNKTLMPDINNVYVYHDNIILSGSGIKDSIKSIKNKSELFSETLKKIKTVGSVVASVYTSKPATIARNYITSFDKNPNRKPGYPGELHIPLPTQYGWSIASFCGPGTNLKERLKRGDKGVDGLFGADEVCKDHDIAYSEATSIKDIKDADKQFIRDIDDADIGKKTRTILKKGMQAKRLAEDINLMDTSDWLKNNKGQGMKRNNNIKKKRGGAFFPAKNLKKQMWKNI